VVKKQKSLLHFYSLILKEQGIQSEGNLGVYKKGLLCMNTADM
jgi:hypothetical protein